MKIKRNLVLLVLIILTVIGVAHADMNWPTALNCIEEEAFYGDTALSGMLAIPESVTQVGTNAFSGTRVYALIVPSSVQTLGIQSLTEAAYVRFDGNTQSDGLSGARCVIAPEDSPAMHAAQACGIRCIALSDLIESGGFYYERRGSNLQLICAVDGSSMSGTVTIPHAVQGLAVTGVSDYAFIGGSQLREIILPDTLKGRMPASAITACPDVMVSYYTTDGLTAIDVVAESEHCTPGSVIVWHVTGLADTSGLHYAYTLTKDGEIAFQAESTEATYGRALEEAGVYSLSVEVSGAVGVVARGASAPVYCSIANEGLSLTVPETIIAGEDLSVTFDECEGALHYNLFLTEEESGALIGSRYLSTNTSVTFDGYLLEPGVYRVTGYVYGNSYATALPTVRQVTVIGEKTGIGPSFAAPESVYVSNGFSIQTEPGCAVWRTDTDSEGNEFYNQKWVYGESFVWIDAYDERFTEGGAITLRFARRVDGRWTDWGPATTIQVLPTPKLEAPVIIIPDDLVPGRDTTLRFEAVENAERYWYEVSNSLYDEPIAHEENSKAGTIFLAGYDLVPGEYTVSVTAIAEGYQSGRNEQTLIVSGEMADGPACTVDKDIIYTDGDDVIITVTAPGAEGAYVLMRPIRSSDGNRRGYRERMIQLDETGQGTLREYFDWDSGEMGRGWQLEIMASAVTDGIWSAWSEPIRIDISTCEALPEVVISAPGALRAGEDLIFRFDEAENADTYNVSVWSFYGNNRVDWYENNIEPGADLTLQGYKLSTGSYRITVTANGTGYASSTTEAVFTVSGTRPAAPTVTASAETLYPNKSVAFTIEAEDAEEVCVTQKSSKGNADYGTSTYSPTIQNGSAVWRMTPNQNNIGWDYTLSFCVKRDGCWSAWRVLNYTVQDLPPLDPPVIHTEPTYEAGEDITFTFDPVENANTYQYVLTYPGGRRTDVCRPGEPVVIDGYRLESGTCRLEITAASPEYVSGSGVALFDIVGSKPAARDVTVSSNAVTMGELISFTIDTSNVEMLYYQCLGDNYLYSSGYISVFDTSTNWSHTIRWGTGEFTYEFTYSFTALVDGRWTAWSDGIIVSVTEAEALDPPAIDLSNSISAGEDLVVMLSSPSAESYYVTIYNSRGMQVTSKNLYSNEGILTFEGFRLPQGTLRVHVRAEAGCLSREVDRIVQVIAEQRPNAPEVEAETEVRTANNYFSFYIVSEGAEQAAVRYYQDGAPNDVYYTPFNVEGDTTTWRHRISTAGTTWHYAFAVCIDSIWSGWSETHTVTISDREQLGKATLNVPESVTAGEDVYVSFEAVEHADSYSLRLYKPSGDYSSWTAYPGIERRISGQDLTAGVYRVMVIASGAEYESSQAEASFSVTGTREAAPELSVDVSEVFTDEKITFTIFDTQDCEEIAYRYRYDSGSTYTSTIKVLSHTTVWETSLSRKGVVSYAFATLKNGRWSAWSNPIQILVKDRPPMSAPTISLPEVINAGQDLIVTVGAVEDASSYYVYVYNNRGESVAYRYLSQAGDAVIQGYLLPLGSLRVEVEAYGRSGGRSIATDVTRVVQADRPVAPVVTAPENATVPRNTYFRFDVATADANNVAVRYYRIGNPNDLNYSTFAPTANEEATNWQTSVYNGGVTMAYSFAVQVDGVWSVWSDFVEITIE